MFLLRRKFIMKGSCIIKYYMISRKQRQNVKNSKRNGRLLASSS